MIAELTLAAQPALLCAAMAGAAPSCASARPALIAHSAPSDIIHYFGVGSNMHRRKVETRAADGRLELLDFRPAKVHGHRLAFNLRGFAPLEPGIGALEPSTACAECHGALITMTAAEYERLWLSEGGGQGADGPDGPDYEEIVVEARPYGSGELPVQAIALRAREHARLAFDACPSERYMRMLRDGARDLQLEPQYIAALEAQTTQAVPAVLRSIAVSHLFFVAALFRLHLRWAVRLTSALLWSAYVPSTHVSRARRAIGDAATALLLAPGAALGTLIRLAMWATCTPPPPILAKYARMRPGCPTQACG